MEQLVVLPEVGNAQQPEQAHQRLEALRERYQQWL